MIEIVRPIRHGTHLKKRERLNTPAPHPFNSQYLNQSFNCSHQKLEKWLSCWCKFKRSTMNNLNGHFDSLNIKISIKIFFYICMCMRASALRSYFYSYKNRFTLAYCVYWIVCNVYVLLLLMTNVRVQCESYEAI